MGPHEGSLGSGDFPAVLERVKDDACGVAGSAALRRCSASLRIPDTLSARRGVAGAFTSGRQKENLMLRIYDLSLSVIAMLKPVVGSIERRDSDLGRQMRRALASVALNIAEGSYARGRNRLALYNVALGSAKESRACLDVALALGYVESVDPQVLAGLSSICAVLYRLAT
jgi:four helix bundle protein